MRPFVCPICNAVYKHSRNLTSHMKVHTGETGCPYCRKRFSNKGSAGEGFPCHICGSVYRHRTNLYSHLRAHNGSTYCSICDKSFSLVGNYKRHMSLVHTPQRKDT
nr:PREDICTED: replication initiator 1-like [Bemisia tabaci]